MTQRFVGSNTIPPSALVYHCKKGALWLLSLVILSSCMLFLSFGRVTPDSEASSTANTAIPASTTSPTLPTKWWIKTPAMPLPAMPTEPITNAAEECQTRLSLPLQAGIYAYISLVPPLPNRVRAGAGRATPHLGQIQPGAGVKIIEGPVCADGLSWWLVESAEDGLRGWTVGGRESEQWIMPCPNPSVACKMTALISQGIPTAVPSSTQNNNRDACASEQFSIGVITQVEQDDLLVIRSEPYTGSVIGHAGPASSVSIINGPACAGGALWWEVNVTSLNLRGWATEANLRPCTKEDDCT